MYNDKIEIRSAELFSRRYAEGGFAVYCIVSHSTEETVALAARLGVALPADTLLLLSGELGAGKTAFAQGLALGLGVAERVSSPTYMLAQEYESGRLPFCHLDAYRLEGCELDALGLEEYWQCGGICLIEWGQLLESILPENRTCLDIELLSENERRLCFYGEHEALIAELLGGKDI